MIRTKLLVGTAVGLVLVLAVFLIYRQLLLGKETVVSPIESTTSSPLATSIPSPSALSSSPDTTTQELRADEIARAAKEFTFSASLPKAWRAEAVPAIEAINVYDPAAAGSTNLEKSQLFIRHFEANDFLTLSTVTIHARATETINGRPAVRYDIEKKATVADFPNQPSWRNARHIVTDIRVSDSNPSVFYVIAKRPDLDEKIYQDFLASFEVSAQELLEAPVAEFRERITKKTFGILIQQETSPVQPERFSGYHTAVDVEYEDVTGEVPVRAIADGTVVVSKTASGYGGVIAIEHKLNGQKVYGIYGHLQPSSLPKNGSAVKAGTEIGELGVGNSAETDGERRHLHFGLAKTADIRGYVSSNAELSNWYDPLEFEYTN